METPDAHTAAHELAVEQDQVAPLLDRIPDGDFDAELNPLALERLMLLGHFPSYAHELDWTPRQIAGHLRDSARVFTDRIRAIRQQDRPQLEEFVTDDPDRLAAYAELPREQLRAELDEAQAGLRAAVASVTVAELDRAGLHPTDGVVTLRRMLAWLPEHQRDHREQLAAFAAAPF